MPVESDTDRASFVDGDEFGVSVSWAHTGGPTVLNAIFDAEYELLVTSELEDGAEGTVPQILCRTADIPGAGAHGDVLTIDSTDYNVVEIKPDGTGMTSVRLQET